MDGTVLLADDDRSIRMVLTQALTRAGCRVHATGSLAQLMRWVEEGRGDVVVTDVMMPDGNGIDLIPTIRRARPGLPVIVVSAQNTIVTAIRASEADAFDYLPKPFDLHELLARVRAAMGRRAVAEAPPQASDAIDPALPLIGRAPVMQDLFRRVALVLNADLPLLVTGEAGAGKTILARALHELSQRGDQPLVILSPAEGLAALGPGGDAAQGGTVLIEDLAGFAPDAQARLAALTAIWLDRKADAPPRLVATAGADPQGDVDAGRLRADLYYRLAGVTLAMPPLRARIEDIPALARHLLSRAAAQGLPARRLDDAAAQLLRSHPFLGNLRELDYLMRRLALTAAGTEIGAAELRAALGCTAATLPPAERTVLPASPALSESVQAHLRRYFDLHGDQLPPPGLYHRVIAEVEHPLLKLALEATGGNQLKAAELLGINRNTLRSKLTALNIGVTRRRDLV